jgi:hypothetical protein
MGRGKLAFWRLVLILLAMIWAGSAEAARYVDNLDKTVRDNRTGLTWQKSDDGTTRSWDDAVSYCDTLNLGGRDDWRLPRVDELRTIVDYLRYSPAIDPVFNSNLTFYWSSSTNVNGPDAPWPYDRWSVDFWIGEVLAYSNPYGNYVRCVRGGPFWPFDPSEHLVPDGDTVQDRLNGYVWQRSTDDQGYAWEEAQGYCAGQAIGGQSGWRLPAIEELMTIIDYERYDPALSKNVWQNPRPFNYWSSTSWASATGNAWLVKFYGSQDLQSGGVHGHGKFYGDYVRCVRGGPETFGTLNLLKSGNGNGNVTSVPGKMDCGADCNEQNGEFGVGMPVTLKALADAGSKFAGWSGPCTGAGECSITMAAVVDVTAEFTKATPSVPAFSGLGMVAFGVLLAVSAILFLRRKEA